MTSKVIQGHNDDLFYIHILKLQYYVYSRKYETNLTKRLAFRF